MVIDTSALIAILTREPDALSFAEAIERDPVRSISAGTLIECGIVVESRRGDAGGRDLDALLHRIKAEIVPVDESQASLAREAFRTYGKGRHAASLNFGDCFSYALAVSRGDTLLYKGNDFSYTDVRSVTM